MAETLTIRTAISTEVVKIAVPGPQGPVGSTGAAGPANTLSIGTVTSGITASATITGTAPSQTISLVLPKGDTGPQGPAGTGITTLTTAGDLLTHDGDSAVRLPVGEPLQTLRVNADGDAVEWAEPSGGVTSYNDLDDLPSLGTAAAANVEDFATSSQGALAEAALQPEDAASLSVDFATNSDEAAAATKLIDDTTKSTVLQYSSVGNDGEKWSVANPSDFRAGLGLGTSATQNTTAFDPAGTAASEVSTHAGKTDGTAHSISGISGLQSALDGKQAAGSYAAASHTHAASDVTSGTLDIARIPTGTSSTTVCLGNDARLSDARTPFSHTHTPSEVGLSNVTNNAQTQAAIVPNTAPSAGQILAGNAGGTAYAPVSISGDATLASTGALTLADSGVSASTYKSVTVDAKGRVTSGTNPTTLSGYGITDAATSSQGTKADSALQPTLADAKGDLLVGTANDTVARLAVSGNNGYVLTEDSSQSAGVKWAALPAGGTKTVMRWDALMNQPPSANYATLDTRNSIAVLDFDASTDESAVFVGVIPEGASLGSGLTVYIHWMATTATSGNVRWGAQIERSNTDLDSDSFDTATEANGAANGTSGIVTVTSITLTSIDSVTAGDLFRLKIYRNADDATNDTMSGDAELVAVELRSAA